MGIGSSGVANYANTRLALAIRTIALGNMGDFEVVSDDGVGLGLNFQTMTALDPRITFSRTSNATAVGSDGLVQYAPHNLLTYSENFDDAVWSKVRSSISSNVIVAPDGTMTADSLNDDGAAVGQGYAGQNVVAYTGSTYTFSFYAKAKELTSVRCYMTDSVGIVSASNALVDLVTGSVISGAATVTDVGSGWFRISVSGIPTAGAGSVRILLPTDTATTNGIYLWGAQLNEGSLQPYYTTSVKNLLGYSQNFDNATGWVSAAPYSVIPNAIIGPDGTTTADAIILASGSTSFNTNVTRQIVTKAASAVRYTHSCYIKAKGAATSVRIVDFGLSAANSALVIVSLIDGSIISAPSVTGTFTGASVTVESLQNGWFRIALTYTTDTATTLTVRHFPYNGNTQLLGDGDSGLYLWGAQLSDSASLDPYSYNFGAAPTSTAYYGPRFDYDPVTLAPKGLLIEEQRTNLLTWSEQFDNAIWSKNSVSVTANTVIAPDGTTTADKITPDLVSGEHSVTSGIAVSIGTTYTVTVYAKADGYNYLFIRGMGLGGSGGARFNIATGVVEGVANYSSASITALSNGWYRCTATGTAVATTGIYLNVSNQSTFAAFSGDGTSGIYLWGAQLEAGAFPTSYIPTTSASVTRAADNASMTGTNFSSWYNQSEGTMVCSSDCFGQTLNFPSVWWTDDGTLNNYLAEYYYSNIMGATQRANTISYGDLNCVGTINPLSINKSAYSYRTNDSAISVNGSALTGIAVDNTITLPLLSRFNIGAKGGVSNYLNGHIQSIRYYPRRLANGDLQALTR